MKILIRDIQDKVKLKKEYLSSFIGFVLEFMEKKDIEVSILLVDDAYIKKLNWQYLKVNSPTDVLAFPIGEASILGDVVISCEMADRVAEKRKEPVQKEIFLYLVHGILHLLGYCDKLPLQRKKMQAKEKEILNLFERRR